MHGLKLEAIAADHLRSGARVSAASIVWTTVSSSLALVIGLRAHSLVLGAFGLTGSFDAAGSATLLAHFRHALRHEAFSERHEHRAMRVGTGGLLVVGTLTAGGRAPRPVRPAAPPPVAGGTVLAPAA